MRSSLLTPALIITLTVLSSTTAYAGAKDKFTSFVLGLGVKTVLSEVQVQKGLGLIVSEYKKNEKEFATEQSTVMDIKVGNDRQLIYTFRLNNKLHFTEDVAAAGSLEAYAGFIRKSVSSNLCTLHGPSANGVNEWYGQNNITLVYEYFTPDNVFLTALAINPRKDC